MFRAGIVSLLVIGLAGVAQAGLPPGYLGLPIDQITVANADVTFGPGGVGSTLSLDAHTGMTTIYYDGDPNTTTFSGDFDLDTILVHDWSSGDLADGWFESGTWALMYGAEDLIAGDVTWYRVAELQDNPGVLVGVGALVTSGGLLVDEEDWPAGAGSTSSVMFMLDIDPNSFGQPFSGSAMINLAPDERYIPEPITALLLVGGLLAVRRRT